MYPWEILGDPRAVTQLILSSRSQGWIPGVREWNEVGKITGRQSIFLGKQGLTGLFDKIRYNSPPNH